jgi:fumarylacetoacetase
MSGNLRDTSWVESANKAGCGFPLQNLPCCGFETAAGEIHIGVGIGDSILDLNQAAKNGLLDSLSDEVREACEAATLNGLMACGVDANGELRRRLTELLRQEAGEASIEAMRTMLLPVEGAAFRKPVAVGNYSDFYASVHHATNVGKLFRPEQPLLPNYKWIPIGYHGRASSLVISRSPVVRPRGQTKPPTADAPTFGASRQLDYELEVAAYIGCGNALGEPISIAEAERHLFGISLLNDWSARDVQSWEYQPLGPFLGKSFATSVSPWVVSMEALAPYRVALAKRGEDDPKPLAYLQDLEIGRAGIDLKLEVYLATDAMRERGLAPMRVSEGNLRDLYWSFAQMVAHHTSNGCNLLPGDLIASGTVSGPDEGMQGCLLEMTRRGAAPLQLPSGESRTFLEDGDEVILRGFCEREGLPRIGLGECRGMIAPALVKG